jgi:hypothetical protein
MMADTRTTVCVTLEDREDGGLRVSSTKLPGLILSGPDKAAVVAKIAPAIKAIFKAAKGLDVTVHPEKPIDEILDGKNPQTVDMDVQSDDTTGRTGAHIHHKLFVVEFRQAA